MRTWIALFRGINVMGRKLLPMKELVALMERGGFKGVRSYIQSGNVVFQCSRGTPRSLGTRIAGLVRKSRGFSPKVLVLGAEELAAAIAANPFTEAERDHKALHLLFLAELPQAANLALLTQLKVGREAFALKDKVFYLHTPDGFPQSRVRSRAERCIGVDATARNWRTVNTLLRIARGRARELSRSQLAATGSSPRARRQLRR